MAVLPCGCGNLGCPYCNPAPANFNFIPQGVVIYAEQGWQCPVCQMVYSPTMPFCTNCKPKYKQQTSKDEV